MAGYFAIGILLGIPILVFLIFLVLYIWFKNIWNYVCCERCQLSDKEFEAVDNNESRNEIKKNNLRELSVLQSRNKDMQIK
jgi:hypothetical protein